MSNDETVERPSDDEQIVPTTPGANPGTVDGVGEHVVEGMGHDGVRQMDGEFAHLETVASTEEEVTPDPDVEPSTQEG